MKKILGLFLLFSISISCSSDDENSVNSDSSINPPNWIQGTWLLPNSGINSGFKFTSNDFCLITSSIQSCNKYNIEQSVIETNVVEEITNDYYSIEITIGSSVSYYQFEKVSNTQIRWLNGIDAIYVKQ